MDDQQLLERWRGVRGIGHIAVDGKRVIGLKRAHYLELLAQAGVIRKISPKKAIWIPRKK
jgi:hypothetical protein